MKQHSTENKQSDHLSVEEPVVLVNENCECIGINDAALEIHRCDRDEYVGSNSEDWLVNPSLEQGMKFQQVIAGEEMLAEYQVLLHDGTVATFTSQLEPVELDGDTYVKTTIQNVEHHEEDTQVPEQKSEIDSFDGIEDGEVARIAQNIRIEYDGSTLPLSAVMLDLTAGHSMITDYRKGALGLYKAVDERLQEEERRNPDSPECQILEGVKDSAFTLYQRVQKGEDHF